MRTCPGGYCKGGAARAGPYFAQGPSSRLELELGLNGTGPAACGL